MVNQIANEIEKSIENECYLGALTMALTLPDMCGKAEYPTLGVKARYTQWYEEYIGKYYREMSRSDDPEVADLPYISGELIYALRCDLLHSGTVDVNGHSMTEEQNALTDFRLLIPSAKMKFTKATDTTITYGECGNVSSRSFVVSIPFLCSVISNVARQFYNANKEKFAFLKDFIIDERLSIKGDTDYEKQ